MKLTKGKTRIDREIENFRCLGKKEGKEASKTATNDEIF